MLAVVYGYTTGGNRLGPLTAGYYGGVGDHLGYTLLITLTVAAAPPRARRGGHPRRRPAALAGLAGTDEAPAAVAPAYPSYWPLLGAFGATLVALGLVISNVLFMVGAFLLVAVLVEWIVLAWSDHATGDPETNHLIRRRMMAPFEVPLAGFLVAGGSVIAFSRVLLTSSELGAVWVAVRHRGRGARSSASCSPPGRTCRPNVVAGVLTTLGIAVVVIGVTSAARGERFIEEHPEEHAEEEAEHDAARATSPPATRRSRPRAPSPSPPPRSRRERVDDRSQRSRPPPLARSRCSSRWRSSSPPAPRTRRSTPSSRRVPRRS